jgi:hypothetical protein
VKHLPVEERAEEARLAYLPPSSAPPLLTGLNMASWRLLQSTTSSELGMVQVFFWR